MPNRRCSVNPAPRLTNPDLSTQDILAAVRIYYQVFKVSGIRIPPTPTTSFNEFPQKYFEHFFPNEWVDFLSSCDASNVLALVSELSRKCPLTSTELSRALLFWTRFYKEYHQCKLRWNFTKHMFKLSFLIVGFMVFQNFRKNFAKIFYMIRSRQWRS